MDSGKGDRAGIQSEVEGGVSGEIEEGTKFAGEKEGDVRPGVGVSCGGIGGGGEDMAIGRGAEVWSED